MKAWDDPRIIAGMKAQLSTRRERIAAGEKPLGWKAGLGAPAAQEKFGLDAPLVGFLLQSAVVPSGGRVSLAGWTKPVAEPEIAVTMGADLPAGADENAARAAIAAMGPAIELADMNPPPEDVTEILRANIWQRHVVLGPRDAGRAGGDARGLTARVSRDGGAPAEESAVEKNTGAILMVVRHIADLLGASGERLRAGEIIIAGSITPPLFLEPSERRLDYTLDPIGAVSVEFTR